MKKLKVCLFLLFVGCSATTWANVPQRIISLVPVVTKEIYQLGAKKQLVGCTKFCTLENPNDAQVVASAVKVNMEKALLLKPDLVISSSLIPRENIELFRKMGIEVLDLPYPKSFDEICSQLLLLGEKIGKEERAKELIHKATSKLETIRAKVPNRHEQFSVFMQIGANPLFGVVPHTFMNDFITFANCRNIADKMSNGSISREAVLLSNPDYIFVVFMGSMGNDEGEKWKKYNSLKAVQQQHIFELDSRMACSPTPDDFVSVLAQIINDIYN